jgi:hypothetical protein
MKRKWLRGVSRIVWVGLRDPVRRRRWKLLFRLGCGMALVSLLLFVCLGCLFLGVLVGRAGAAAPGAGLEGPLAVGNSDPALDTGDGMLEPMPCCLGEGGLALRGAISSGFHVGGRQGLE